MPGEIRRIAAFLDIPIDEARWAAILEHCSFDYMKANATRARRSAARSGTAGRRPSSTRAPTAAGATMLTAEDSAGYERRAIAELLGPAAAAWLLSGRR